MGKFRDVADLPEDERIAEIGKHCMALAAGKKGAFVVDDHPPEKVERYIRKLKERFPDLIVLKSMAGPGKGMISVIISRKLKPNK